MKSCTVHRQQRGGNPRDIRVWRNSVWRQRHSYTYIHTKTGRQAGRQQAGRQADRQTDRQTGRHRQTMPEQLHAYPSQNKSFYSFESLGVTSPPLAAPARARTPPPRSPPPLSPLHLEGHLGGGEAGAAARAPRSSAPAFAAALPAQLPGQQMPAPAQPWPLHRPLLRLRVRGARRRRRPPTQRGVDYRCGGTKPRRQSRRRKRRWQ